MVDAINSDYDSGKREYQHRMMGMLEEGCLDFPTFCFNRSFSENIYPLQALSRIGYVDVVEWFLEEGCDADGHAPWYWSGNLSWAVYSGNLDIVEVLLEHGADPEYLW